MSAVDQLARPVNPFRIKLSGGILLLPILAFLFIFFIYPLFSMLAISAFDRSGALTFDFYRQALGGRTWSIFLNTLSISLWVTLFTVLLSYPVAYYLATSKGRSTNLILIIVLLPFWTSALVRAFAWMLLLGRNGVINSTMVNLGITEVPADLLFNLFSVLIGMVHALMPIAVLSMLATMQNIDRNLHSAAATLGAEPGDTFWRVFFPISFPGVASAALVTFIVSMGIFVQPSLLGSPRETMVAQLIIQQIDELYNWGLAAAVSVMVLVLSVIIILIFDKLLGIASISGTQQAGGASGKAMRSITAALGTATVAVSRAIRRALPQRKVKEGAFRWVLAVPTLLIVLFLAAPTFFLVPVSFTGSSFMEWPPRGFSLQWYEAYFTSPVWREATVRSIIVALVTATASLAIGVPAAFALTRSKFKGKAIVLPYILLPIVAPNIIVALSLFYYFSSIGLVGTDIGLVIGHTVFAVPYVVLTMIATLSIYDQRLDQAAWTLGATPLTTFRLITLPMIKVGFVTSFLFAFVRSFDEVTVALFISPGLSTTLPKRMWTEAHHSVEPTLAAVSTILIIMVILVITASELLKRRGLGR
ncbi:ABC transporter permease subunit [Aquamicrobium sp. LC103]|uniref:ABC transporter permease subunit n=1 Tax=Aquamicrobium sp. LC103 TaxID=1120658 RepID=UPI00063EC843|nr:ABC transporter permease subunit [Aquamicrobium sp. LC103]TKT69429.1 ABC transporter permease subunit [Aquamicrobium sp. LC103]